MLQAKLSQKPSNALKQIANVLTLFSRKNILHAAWKYPKSYKLLISLFALFGVAYLLLLPVLCLSLPIVVYQKVMLAPGWLVGAEVLWPMSLWILSVVLSYALFKIRISAPKGIELSAEKQPVLFKEIDAIRQRFNHVTIHRVVLNESSSIRVVKTPRWFLPVVSDRTLVIGLPMMLCNPPEYFQAQLVSAIGKLSGKHNFVLSNLYFFSTSWAHIEQFCHTRSTLVFTILGYYLSIYARLFQYFAVAIHHQYELEKHVYALELVNDEVCVQAIAFDYLLKNYLNKNYWPSVQQLQGQYENAGYYPFSSMRDHVCNGIRQYDNRAVIERLMNMRMSKRMELPSFKQRIEYLGVFHPQVPKVSHQNTAEIFLGASYLPAVKVMDDLWLKRQTGWKQTQPRAFNHRK